MLLKSGSLQKLTIIKKKKKKKMVSVHNVLSLLSLLQVDVFFSMFFCE
jgi:hypothetical protein